MKNLIQISHPRGPASAYADLNPFDWRTPTPEALLRDEVRLAHWAAVRSGNPKKIASTLKAWSDLLRVKRTRHANQTS